MLRLVYDVERLGDDNAFWGALVLAILGYGVGWGRARAAHPEPGPALGAGGARLAGLRVADRVALARRVGVVLLLGGEWIGRRAGCWTRAFWLLPGAVVIGAALPEGWPFWMRVVTSVTAVLGGSLTVATNAAAPRLVPALFAVGAVGLYF